MHFFPLTTFLVVALKTQAGKNTHWVFHCQNKTSTTVTDGYRSSPVIWPGAPWCSAATEENNEEKEEEEEEEKEYI